jgi:hypothetical protein
MIKKGDVFQPLTNQDKILYNQFKDLVADGSVIEITMQVHTPNATLAQISKIHAMIRQLANHSGHTFDEMKYYVKDRAGLIIQTAGTSVVKSFGDCSKSELSDVIQAAIELGQQLGCQVY